MRIAITGGIGSGKSAVCKILNSLGEKTISLDGVYKNLLKNEDFCIGVCNAVGMQPKKISGKNVVDFEALSKKVFDCESALNALNAFTHPRIFAAAFSEGQKFENERCAVFYEVPLLFEGGYVGLFDKVWVVTRELNSRLKSAALRDGASELSIKKRVEKQFDYDNNDLSAHTIIPNDGDFVELEKRVVCALNEVKNKVERG